MRFAFTLIGVLILATAVTRSLAAESDAELLQQLESAATVAQFGGTVFAINKRLETAPLDSAYVDRIVIELAAGFAREWVLNYSAADRAAIVVRGSARPLPDAAVESLFSALEHRAMLNRWGAINVLATLPATHPQRSRAIDAMAMLVRSHEHQHTRTTAAVALKEFGQDAPLPETAILALIDAAQNDEYVTVRIDAADALSYQSLEPVRTESVTRPLAAELIKPTDVTSRARGLIYFEQYPGRAQEVLARMYEPPYPAHVIDVWISQTRAPVQRGAIKMLRAAVVRGELSPAQHEQLLAGARTAYTYEQSVDIYATAFAGSTAAELAKATQVLTTQSPNADRLEAAHLLHSYYRENGVPPNIADIAASQIIEETDPAVTRALALLLLDATNSTTRGNQLIDGLIAHAESSQAWNQILPLLSLEHLELLITRAVANENLSANFRYMVLNNFASRAGNGDTLSTEVTDTLVAAARSSNDYLVSQSASAALSAWGESVPLKAKLANRRNQSAALGYLFLFLCVTNIVAGIVGSISVIVMPLQSKDGGPATLKRSGVIIGWTLLSCVILLLMMIAFVGFIGHNTAPPPSQSLSLNIPLYIGTGIYLPLAWLSLRRARNRARDAGDDAIAT